MANTDDRRLTSQGGNEYSPPRRAVRSRPRDSATGLQSSPDSRGLTATARGRAEAVLAATQRSDTRGRARGERAAVARSAARPAPGHALEPVRPRARAHGVTLILTPSVRPRGPGS